MQLCGEVMRQPVINILFLSTTYFAVVRTVQRVGVPQFIFVDKAFLLHILYKPLPPQVQVLVCQK